MLYTYYFRFSFLIENSVIDKIGLFSPNFI